MLILEIILSVFLTFEFIKDGCEIYFHAHTFPMILTFMSALSKIVLVYLLISLRVTREKFMWYAVWSIVAIAIMMLFLAISKIKKNNIEEEERLLSV